MKKDIIYIEFNGENPFEIILSDGTFLDVDFSNRDKCLYYHFSGMGISDPIKAGNYADGTPVPFWAAAGVNVSGGRRVNLPEEYKSPLNEWQHTEEMETVYCNICCDHIPDSEDSMCDHITWSHYHSDNIGTGCYDGTPEDVLVLFLKLPGIALQIYTALISGKDYRDLFYDMNNWSHRYNCGDYWPLGREFPVLQCDDEMVDKIQTATSWLTTLEFEKTKDAEYELIDLIRQGLTED